MADEREPESDLNAHPAVRGYSLLCLLCLLALTLLVVDRGMGWWGLLPVLLGAAALLFRWSIGPPLLLAALALLLAVEARFRGAPASWERSTLLADLLACVAVLGYAAGQYRLLALTRHVLPPDTRRRTLPGQGRGARDEHPEPTRSPGSVGPWELPGLLLTLPLWALAALVVRTWVRWEEPLPEVPPELWRLVLLAWVFGLGLAVAAAGLGYLGLAQATRAEARLYLQDQLWRETRKDQSRLNRWLVWGRLRRQRRKERA